MLVLLILGHCESAEQKQMGKKTGYKSDKLPFLHMLPLLESLSYLFEQIECTPLYLFLLSVSLFHFFSRTVCFQSPSGSVCSL